MRHKWMFAAVLLGTLVAFAQKNDSPDVMLGAGLHQEEVEGNCKAAIEIYQKIIQQKNVSRNAAARAQLHIGTCQEKLGNTEARKTYERVVREFADQKEVAADAKRRLESMQSPAPGAVQVTRRIWANAGITVTPPSTDGRYLAYIDPAGDVFIRDLKEGTTRRLTNAAGSGDLGAASEAISPDGRQVAYAWEGRAKGYELRILPVNAAGTTKPRTVYHETYFQPMAWTPDATALVGLRFKEGTWQMASISVADESVHVLKSLGPLAPFRISVSPDGRYFAYDIPSSENLDARDIFVLNADGSRETAVAQSPANDTEPMWSPDGSHLIFESNRGGKRALWSVRMQEGMPKGPAELINAEIPASFYAVGMTRTGALYYGQNVGLTNVYTVDLDEKLNAKGTPVRITDRGINSNSRPGWSPDGRSLAYVSNRGDSLVLVIRSINTGEERELPVQVPQNGFAGPLTWFPDGRSLLVTSIDSQKSRIGYYRIDVVSGSAQLLHSSANRGVHAQRPDISPDGKTIFYSDVDSESPILARFDMDTSRKTVLKRWEGLRFCTAVAVSPDGSQLAYTVSDQPPRSASVEVISTGGGESREVVRVDGWLDDSRFAGLAWSTDQRYLLFVKPEKAEHDPRQTLIWRVPVTGGKPESVGISMDVLRFPRIHPDGRRIAFVSLVPQSRELWALENFVPRW